MLHNLQLTCILFGLPFLLLYCKLHCPLHQPPNLKLANRSNNPQSLHVQLYNRCDNRTRSLDQCIVPRGGPYFQLLLWYPGKYLLARANLLSDLSFTSTNWEHLRQGQEDAPLGALWLLRYSSHILSRNVWPPNA